MNNKERYISLLENLILNRDGMEELIKFLSESDFFHAPASTQYHGNYEGGLLEHSLNVHDVLCEEVNQSCYKNIFNKDSLVIVSLLHDICKTNFYKEELKWKKDKNNQWESYMAFVIDDQEPYGHGEKSVMMISKYIKLTDEEMYAIRWHMGAFDNAVKGGDYGMNKTFEKYPLALALHLSDMKASNLLERKEVK